jgi:hypothetical protein
MRFELVSLEKQLLTIEFAIEWAFDLYLLTFIQQMIDIIGISHWLVAFAAVVSILHLSGDREPTHIHISRIIIILISTILALHENKI